LKRAQTLWALLGASLLVATPQSAPAERQDLLHEIQALDAYLSKAHMAGGARCAPEALATAQICLAKVKEELEEGDRWEAEDLLVSCQRLSQGLWDRIVLCGQDTDEDGIPDSTDQCPDQPETYNGYRDEDGCPDRVPSRALLTPDKIEILEPLAFDEGTQALLHESEPVLADVARILAENPSVRIRIEAHLDGSTDPEAAFSICSRRAENVKDALSALGVDAARMETAPKGSAEPIASNDSPWGRKVNRRIEFVRIP